MVEKQHDDLDEREKRRVQDLYRQTAPLSTGARERLDRALRGASRTSRGGLFARLAEPRLVAVRPLTAIAVSAALVAAGLWLGRATRSPLETSAPEAPVASWIGSDSVRVVQFVLVAPRATSVSLVGDFNGWDAAATPLRRVADGETWMAALPVKDGRYVYAFVVDGARWVPDPLAPLAPEDGFGTENSVIVVGGKGAT